MNRYQKEYADFLRKFLALSKPLKIVFDCSNGTTEEIINRITNYELRIKKGNKFAIRNPKFIIINGNPDGNFPGHGPNPLVKGAMGQLKKSVLKSKADLGIIFDADGDRAFFIDDKGRFVYPDEIAYLLIWSLKPKKFVYDVRTGWLVRKMENGEWEMGISESRVGHYFIKKLMREKDIEFGCEQSGHYYFKKFFYADSGILAAIEVINAVSKLPYKFSDFCGLLPQYYRSGEINIRIKNSVRQLAERIKEIEKRYKSASRRTAAKISRLDGLTMEFEKFWFNIRTSNTEPLARLNVEATDKRILAKQTKILLGLLRKSTND